MVKIDRDLYFLKDNRLSSGNVNMAKIYERLLSTNILRGNRRDSFDPQRENLWAKVGFVWITCWKNRKGSFFFCLLHH